ncbi:DUF2510 domain-containing protein [Paenarthrobacter sp. NPDC056912]|uniref:DUF2510 domain-containing protein n=1 Tax=Paenarthrobacter sp. NPDC056912 TaxID=3345965 RepID=UPI003670C6B0
MTQALPGSTPPPGWYPDPSDPRLVRWWDGVAWTAHQGPPSVQYHGQYQPYQMVMPRTLISAQTPVYNPFIWAIVLMALLGVVFLFAWHPEFRTITTRQGVTTIDPLSIYTPMYFLVQISSFVVYGLTVLFAFLDRQRLLRSGVVRPFHWAWAFLGATVYTIGRSVIVRKVALNRGLWPIWVLIAVFVLNIVVAGIWTSNLMQSMYSQFGYSVST